MTGPEQVGVPAAGFGPGRPRGRRPAASRAEQADLTRSRVLAAAARLVAERGYDGVRMQEVAARAGVTTGAIYTHFPDRGALLAAAVAEHANSVFVPAVARQVTESTDPVRSALLEISALLHERPSEVRPALEVEALVAARRDADLAGPLAERLAPVL